MFDDLLNDDDIYLKDEEKNITQEKFINNFSQADIDFECIRWPAGATSLGWYQS